MEDLSLILTEKRKGLNKYIFALGTTKNDQKSNEPIEANIFVCGSETLSLKDEKEKKLKKDKILHSEYSEWFKYKPID